MLANIFSGGTGADLATPRVDRIAGLRRQHALAVSGRRLRGDVVGVATAWLTAMHEFPGRRFFEWALVLPLAMPAYVLALCFQPSIFCSSSVRCRPGCAIALRLASRRLLVPDVQHRRAVAMFVFVPLSLLVHLVGAYSVHRTRQRHVEAAHARHGPVAQLFARRCRWRVRRRRAALV